MGVVDPGFTRVRVHPGLSLIAPLGHRICFFRAPAGEAGEDEGRVGGWVWGPVVVGELRPVGGGDGVGRMLDVGCDEGVFGVLWR